MLGFLATAIWTIYAILQLASPSDPQLRPDGRVCAYVYKGSIYTQGLKPADRPVLFAEGSRPRWSPDATKLAFLHKGQVHVKDARATRAVTKAAAPVTFYAWSPDGQTIGYVANDSSKAADPIVSSEVGPYARLYVQSLSGGLAKLVTKADHHVLSFALSPDRTRAVYAAQPTPLNRDSFTVDLYEVDLASGHQRPLVSQPGRDADPVYSPDGRQVAFHSQAGSDNYFQSRHVALVSSGGGAIRYLTKDLPVDLFRGGATVRWLSNHEVAYSAGRGPTDVLMKQDLQSGTSQVLTERIANAASFSQSGSVAVYLKTSVDRPPEIFVRDAAAERQVTHLQTDVERLPKIRSENITWKSTDGTEIGGVLWFPVNYKQGQRVPMIVELHGGPTGIVLDSFPVPRTYPTQAFLQNGIAVFAPNFRGSINYGAAFRMKVAQSQGIGDYQDVMTGVDALIARGVADPDRLGVMGWSYGGYLTASIVTQTNRFKAASIGAPATDWITYYGQSDAPRQIFQSYFGRAPWEKPETYHRHSPRFGLKNVRTPSLLQVGSQDINHNGEIYQALVDNNVPVEYVVYPREGHGITEPSHVRDLLERNLAWFLRWLKP